MKLNFPTFLVDALIKRAMKNPFNHLGEYMERYWVLDPKGILSRWLTARIHVIKLSDADRHLHDHPWPYTTIILKGGYTEITHWDTMGEAEAWAIKEGHQGGMLWNDEMQKIELRIMYEAGSVLCRPAGFLHRLIVSPGASATTLFIMGAYQNKWGFQTPEGKVYWRDYLDQEDVTKRAAVIKEHYNDRPEVSPGFKIDTGSYSDALNAKEKS